MNQDGRLTSSNGDRRILPVIVLGVLVAIVPLFAIHPPSESRRIAVAVRVFQAISVAVGLGVISTGVYSYRTRNLQPAVTAATTVLGLVVVIVTGSLIELTGGPLIPIWGWVLAALLAIGIALAVTNRIVTADTASSN
ncbi:MULTISPECIES: hypothetical protein [Halococcus]|uniref:Drug resistance transporter, Bcr/CflA subfamily protein n=1 Tax=Halococcus salifodinae DSM 8989 TaxID=1227456 RepID=M0NFQ8_9EURY|nr:MULTISPECIES: hypothetical protein [Halococcus]EMA55495.1 hypothetical protein C450_01974 [Halococcus salifodinae DSM 8989]